MPATHAVPVLIALPSLPASPITGAGPPSDPGGPTLTLVTSHSPPLTGHLPRVIPPRGRLNRGDAPHPKLNTCPAKVNTSGRKLDTSPAKVDTSPSKLNTFGQKLDTFARRLDTLPPKLNTSARPPEHIPSHAHPPPPALRAPSPTVHGEPVEPHPGVPGRDPAPRSIPAHQCRPDLPTIPSPLSLRIAPTTPSPLACRNHLVYTRDTLYPTSLPRPPMLAPLIRLLTFLTPAPACSPSFVGAGLKPASSARDASAPTPRHVRAPSLPRAVLQSPHSPNIRRQPAEKSGPSYLSPARIPRWGFGLARDSSPFTPTQFPPPGTSPQPHPIPATAPCRAAPHSPASRPALATPPWQDLSHPRPAAHPCHTPVRPSPGVAWRVPASAEKRPAAPQEFFGKNSYARKPTPFRAPTRPSRGPASPRDH